MTVLILDYLAARLSRYLLIVMRLGSFKLMKFPSVFAFHCADIISSMMFPLKYEL
jgi:hypothetical protein